MFSLCLVFSHVAVAAAGNASHDFDVGAIYFGDWHVDPIMQLLHGPNWTEWNLVQHATPRWEGHLQPNVPSEAAGWGPSHPENDPANMAVRIDAAADHGIDFFMFDWYWYARGTKASGPEGFPFLDGALEDGFLKAPNRARLKFCLMWATQDWVDGERLLCALVPNGRWRQGPRGRRQPAAL